MFWMMVFLCAGVGGESLGKSVNRELIGNQMKASEWDAQGLEVRREMILRGASPVNVYADSEPHFMIKTICQRCMANNNLHCVSELCLIKRRPYQTTSGTGEKNGHIKQEVSAFATGTSLHADILCSLCKSTRDVMCTMRLCANPNREDIISGDDSVQCMDGFCRWQKNSMLSMGFSSAMYRTWWQPTSWYIWVEDVAKELGQVYRHIVSPLQNLIRPK